MPINLFLESALKKHPSFYRKIRGGQMGFFFKAGGGVFRGRVALGLAICFLVDSSVLGQKLWEVNLESSYLTSFNVILTDKTKRISCHINTPNNISQRR